MSEIPLNIDIKIIFGEKIRDLRKSSNLSQESLAKKSGLHRTYISGVEKGQRNISLENIYSLSVALNIEIQDLFINLK